MAVKFDFYKNPVPPNSKKKTRYHARVVSYGTTDTTELAKIIHQRCTLNVADVKATLIALGELAAEKLSEGHRLHIEGLGYFQMTLKCPEAQTTTELHAQSISFKSVAFRAEQNLKKQLKLTKFERSVAKNHSAAYSGRKTDELLTEYFRENTYIMRRSFEQVCYCTKWMAIKRLKELVAEGKLLKEGAPRSPIYRPVPGYYGTPAPSPLTGYRPTD